MVLLLSLFATSCTPDPFHTRVLSEMPHPVHDGETTDSGVVLPADTGFEPSSVPGGGDSEESEDSAVAEIADLVCYPGSDQAWDACVAVVPWSASWGSDYDYPDPYEGDPQYRAPVRFVDLSIEDPELALAPNFRLDEFMQEWKGRYAVFQPHVVVYMQTIRDWVGGAVSVHSGFRNVGYNSDIDGATYSRHMYGDAVDFSSGSASLTTLQSHCEDLGAGYTDTYESHVHCDWRDDPLEPGFYDESNAARSLAPPSREAHLLPGTPWSAPVLEGWHEGEPLRVWRALDAWGDPLEVVTARTFTPPVGTETVEVTLGNLLVLTAGIEALQ